MYNKGRKRKAARCNNVSDLLYKTVIHMATMGRGIRNSKKRASSIPYPVMTKLVRNKSPAANKPKNCPHLFQLPKDIR